MKDNQCPINVIMVSLDEKFCKKVAKSLSDRLSMFFADCKEMVEYDLINPKEVLEKCGLEYFKKRERAVINNCSQYQNTVVSIDADVFLENTDLFDKSLIIYLRLDKTKVSLIVNRLSFEGYDEHLQDNADISLKLDNKITAETVKKIIRIMGEKL